MGKCARLNRRSFIKTSLAGTIGAGVIGHAQEKAAGPHSPKGELKIKDFRVLGRTGFKVSDIGFGAAGFSNANVLKQAIAMGVNYIDTAEGYGQSEALIGEAIKDVPRGSLFVTTKLFLYRGENTRESLKAKVYQSLEKMRSDYVDCLMIHSCSLEQVKHEGFHAAARELKSEGKVRFLGISNHGIEQKMSGPAEEPMDQVVAAAVRDGRFDVMLFVYNFILRDPGEKILALCKENDIGATLMKINPVDNYRFYVERWENFKKSGRQIDDKIRAQQEKLLKDYEAYIGRADEFRNRHKISSDDQLRAAAIRFALSNPLVHSACISIDNFELLKTCVALSGTRLNAGEQVLLGDYEESLGRYYCRHACGICEKECPKGVAVNTIMRYNHYFGAQGREKYSMLRYRELDGADARACSQCHGACEKACPFQVPIQTLLMAAHQKLTLA